MKLATLPPPAWRPATLVTVIVLSTGTVIVAHPYLEAGARLALAMTACIAWLLLQVPHIRVHVSARIVLIGAGVLMVVAVAVPPRESSDLWTYAMYGRIVAVHGASPYREAPARFSDDPALQRVVPGWRDTPSPYGPLFAVVSAAVATVVGSSALLTRLGFQGLAAAATALTLMLLWRARVGPAGLALLALNPLVFVEVVNGGHNDALVGLAVLASVLLALKARPAWAAAVMALAVLVKVVLILPLVALLLWFLVHRGLRVTARSAAAASATLIAGFALLGGTEVLRPLLGARSQMSRGSMWQLARPGEAAHYLSLGPVPSADSERWVTALAVVSVLTLAAFLVIAARKRITPVPAVVTAVFAYLVVGAYVLPWYVAWIIPVVALSNDALYLRVTGMLTTALLVGWQYRDGVPHDLSPELMGWLIGSIGVMAVTAVCVFLLVRDAAAALRPGRSAQSPLGSTRNEPIRVLPDTSLESRSTTDYMPLEWPG